MGKMSWIFCVENRLFIIVQLSDRFRVKKLSIKMVLCHIKGYSQLKRPEGWGVPMICAGKELSGRCTNKKLSHMYFMWESRHSDSADVLFMNCWKLKLPDELEVFGQI